MGRAQNRTQVPDSRSARTTTSLGKKKPGGCDAPTWGLEPRAGGRSDKPLGQREGPQPQWRCRCRASTKPHWSPPPAPAPLQVSELTPDPTGCPHPSAPAAAHPSLGQVDPGAGLSQPEPASLSVLWHRETPDQLQGTAPPPVDSPNLKIPNGHCLSGGRGFRP